MSLTSVSRSTLCHCQAKLHGVVDSAVSCQAKIPGFVGVMLCGVMDTGESDSNVSCQARLPGVVGVMHTMCGVIDIGESFYTVSLSS